MALELLLIAVHSVFQGPSMAVSNASLISAWVLTCNSSARTRWASRAVFRTLCHQKSHIHFRIYAELLSDFDPIFAP
jgi:hypothetical protein